MTKLTIEYLQTLFNIIEHLSGSISKREILTTCKLARNKKTNHSSIALLKKFMDKQNLF